MNINYEHYTKLRLKIRSKNDKIYALVKRLFIIVSFVVIHDIIP